MVYISQRDRSEDDYEHTDIIKKQMTTYRTDKRCRAGGCLPGNRQPMRGKAGHEDTITRLMRVMTTVQWHW